MDGYGELKTIDRSLLQYTCLSVVLATAEPKGKSEEDGISGRAYRAAGYHGVLF